jgi:nitrogen PTS system EIIA component
MDLKIKDVAELLNVSETTIRRWLTDGKIPAYKLNGQYRFSKIEIENWVISQKMNKKEEEIPQPFSSNYQKQYLNLKDSETKRIISNQIGTQAFSLYRAIFKGGVVHDVEGTTKREVIQESVKMIANSLSMDGEVLTELLMDREGLMPTSLNHGVAVPHTRDFLIQKPFDVVTVVYPKIPLEFDALDGKKVHTLFFLFACEDKRHLHLLAKLAHLTRSAEALEFLQTKPSKTDLLAYIKEWEVKIRPITMEEKVYTDHD